VETCCRPAVVNRLSAGKKLAQMGMSTCVAAAGVQSQLTISVSILEYFSLLSTFDRLTPCSQSIESCAQPQCISNMSTTMIANSSSGLRLSAPFAGTQPVRRSISAPRARYANPLNSCRRCQFSQLPRGDTHLGIGPTLHCATCMLFIDVVLALTEALLRAGSPSQSGPSSSRESRWVVSVVPSPTLHLAQRSPAPPYVSSTDAATNGVVSFC
jgi:hypothetical protein